MFLNVAYRMKFASQLVPVISTPAKIFIDQALNLNGGNSYVSGFTNPEAGKAGIVYKWTCP